MRHAIAGQYNEAHDATPPITTMTATPTPSRPLTILTGASRGLGLGMARALIAEGHALLTLARHDSAELAALARNTPGASLTQWSRDLGDGGARAAADLERWLGTLGASAFASVTLINNAAVLPRIGPIADADPTDIERVLRVGLEAPIALTAALLRATAAWRCPRRVLQISSGNGRRAMAAQSLYSAAKAGLDHFARCVALEEAARANGARICSLAPGIIDTDMQTELRAADPTAFPDHARFVAFHREGLLLGIDAAARRVLAYLARPNFGEEPVADVRD